MYEKPFLTAEIGCNHCGAIKMAQSMVRSAATFCEVPCVKFQKRNVRETLSPEEYGRPHPVPGNSYGATYGEHRETLEFDIERHRALRDYCAEQGVAYACSVWDLSSASEIAGLEPAFIKIPSACNTHFELARRVCDESPGKIHISLGMTTNAEVEAIAAFYAERDRLRDVVLYHCTSGYPVDHEDLNLLEIARLKECYGSAVHGIGFSGHHKGIAMDVAAYTLGATYIERHFTLDRTLKGTDHAASLEPDGLRRLWRDLNAAHRALQKKTEDLLAVEIPQREKLKWDRTP